MGTIRRIADWAGNISTAQWVWSMVGGTVLSFAAWLANQPPYLVLFYGFAAFAFLMIALHKLQLMSYAKEQMRVAKTASPISVASLLYIDFDAVTDELGVAKIDDLHSVALCLQMTNSAQDGKTLNNLSASMYEWGLHRVNLPLRDANSSSIDLKSGDMELVEIGRVLIASVKLGNAPVFPRSGDHRQRTNLANINYAFNPQPGARSLQVSGDKAYGIVQMRGEESGPRPLYITLSATDCPPLKVKMHMNLWAENPYNWLTIVANESDIS